ncbi:MAG: choice-of-anchor J domain-containing protein [Bacteroidota bacterium]|nr:choice-of-anchor J domain-containing protein [Bacteroidota bacterium]
MKRKITLLFAAAVGVFTTNAQTVLNESFTAPFTPSVANWVLANNSTPAPVNSWFQGVGTSTASFPAYSGGPNDYFAADWRAAGTGSTTVAGISNWLITPTVSIYNGAQLTFATRKVTSATQYPDRLVVRMSTAGTSTAVGTTSASVGSFSTTLLDINPLYSNATTSAVVSGSVNGYPQTWTVYTLNISGVTGTVTGRFAFHYLVDDGGGAGNNSDQIGLDDVKYSLPCGASIPSYTTCSGVSTTLTATGGLSGTTYSWAPVSSTLSSVVVSPTITSVYTLSTMDGTVVCPAKTATITVGSNLSINISASSSTICSGNTSTLTASGSATTYSWNTGAFAPVISVTPSITTTYSVGGASGLCFGANTITIFVNAAPNVSLVASAGPTICSTNSTPLTLTASGAVSYVWSSPNSTVTTNVVSLNTPTTVGNYVLSVTGTGTNSCAKTFTAPLVIANCTGIDNNTSVTNNAVAYPNPFTSELTISGVSGLIEVINTLGQVVLTTTISDSQTINTSNFAKGVYFIKVKNADTKGTQTIKIIKD